MRGERRNKRNELKRNERTFTAQNLNMREGGENGKEEKKKDNDSSFLPGLCLSL